MDFSSILSSLGSALKDGSGGDGVQMAGLGSYGLQQQPMQHQQMQMQQQPQRLSIFDLLAHYDQNLRQRMPQQNQNFLTGGY